MHRFVNPNESVALINSLFKIRINNGNVNAEQLYPVGAPNEELKHKVELFAFPDSAALESHSFFTFIVGDIATGFQLGFVLYSSIIEGYCILSNYYYPQLFKTILRNITKDDDISILKSLGTSQRRSILCIKTPDNKTQEFPLDGSRERQKLLELIFHTFSPYDVSKIIIGMLQARHIFVSATNVSVCSLFCAALPLLIEPFKWSLNIIPILPEKLRDMIEVPIPILIGLTRVELLYAKDTSVASHICVNPDTKLVLEDCSLETNQEKTIRVLEEQFKFQTQVTQLLKSWSGCSGFPHLHIIELIHKFIGSYFRIYGGDLCSAEAFAQSISQMPEFLKNSQILQDYQHNHRQNADNFKAFYAAVSDNEVVTSTVITSRTELNSNVVEIQFTSSAKQQQPTFNTNSTNQQQQQQKQEQKNLDLQSSSSSSKLFSNKHTPKFLQKRPTTPTDESDKDKKAKKKEESIKDKKSDDQNKRSHNSDENEKPQGLKFKFMQMFGSQEKASRSSSTISAQSPYVSDKSDHKQKPSPTKTGEPKTIPPPPKYSAHNEPKQVQIPPKFGSATETKTVSQPPKFGSATATQPSKFGSATETKTVQQPPKFGSSTVSSQSKFGSATETKTVSQPPKFGSATATQPPKFGSTTVTHTEPKTVTQPPKYGYQSSTVATHTEPKTVQSTPKFGYQSPTHTEPKTVQPPPKFGIQSSSVVHTEPKTVPPPPQQRYAPGSLPSNPTSSDIAKMTPQDKNALYRQRLAMYSGGAKPKKF
ncbi:DENN domain-containing protein 1A-like isoform X2 [Histomonas meleagridis]|uniref:DENN domain-containing protein 1A-like isoform X2 n=1 Tax=Histomonas meleagridis TaxID=135588 RepID=UPI00355A59D3|nr:DENN domain-containing protein 1A-like isoform X2 [Histomonas meleagridis]KAH0800952.1 DENN domain-containing protein 1A-like isoform X2 [Histomonas meleagridis]